MGDDDSKLIDSGLIDSGLIDSGPVGDDASGGTDVIEVRVPARPEFASFLRLAVASVAADRGFSVDEIDDLRLGVSEVFGALADRAGNGDCCAMRLTIAADRIVVALRGEDASGRAVGGGHAELDALSTTILASVVDEFDTSGDGFVLVKRAVESAAAG